MFFLVLFLTASVSLFYNNTKINYQIDDLSTIVGGRLENYYLSAGYLLSDISINKLNICGGVFIDSNTFITAAHCVDINKNIFVGIGNITNRFTNLYQVIEYRIHPFWSNNSNNNSNKSRNDIAVLKISRGINNLDYPNIVEPVKGCDYQVIGYGRNEPEPNSRKDMNISTRERRSADICVLDVYEEILLVEGVLAGICFGDSGSPIFKKGTNEVVGIISSAEVLEDGYCKIDNKGIAVNLFYYKDFIESRDNSFQSSPSSSFSLDEVNICLDIDANSNNRIDLQDFSRFLTLFNTKCNNFGLYSKCGSVDQNNDGLVNIRDFAIISRKFNKECI